MEYHEFVAVLGFGALFLLLALRVPVGAAMGLVGFGGFAAIAGLDPALAILSLSPIREATSWDLTLIPMFILMGSLATASGMSQRLFDAASAWVGHFRGGIAMAGIGAAAGFAAINGSSMATVAAMARVAAPEMRRFGYSESITCGTLAAGGTLGILIPPSIVLVVYGVLTQQDIGKLFVAGIVPGVIAILFYLMVIVVISKFGSTPLPAGPRPGWSARLKASRQVWPITILFLFVIGGIYAGIFTTSEAASMGAVGTLFLGLAERSLDGKKIINALLDAIETSASIFLILIGAVIFAYFMAASQVPQTITRALVALDFGAYGTLLVILVFLLLLGCILDAMAMVVLTLPIVFPVVVALGFDPIWFGIIMVMTVELGLITPPIGMNVLIMANLSRGVDLRVAFRGVFPFIIADILRLLLLVAFPTLVLFLPAQM